MYIYIYISIYIYIYIYVSKTLNESVNSTTCPRPVSLNCFSGAEKQHLKTALEKQLKDANCVKDIPFFTTQ